MHARTATSKVTASTLPVPATPDATPLSSLNQIICSRLLPQLDYFCARIIREKKALTLDDTPAFTGQDKFLPGKLAIGISYLILNAQRDSAEFDRYLEGFSQIADLTLDDTNDSWGIYYYVAALYRLHQAGLLERALRETTLERLRKNLDWRRFVDASDWRLIDLPTNYYGVAFSIARLRFLLGWEPETASNILLERTVHHYQTYSGEFGFSDETDGEGRFDRYSILLIGEICQRFIETGLAVTDQLKSWLRQSVEIVLLRLNEAGSGFDFGRSIGPYGDTAFLEILSAAASLDVLDAEEREMAYAFAVRAARRYADFWFDQEMHSVNLWEKGRRTDAYRGKHRILGENLSLIHQHIYTNDLWNRMGFKDRTPSTDYDKWLKNLPRFSLTWFARGNYDRALLTFRDGELVISLPLINGGTTQHMHNPYFPIPFSNNLIQGSADADFPQLLPMLILEDGSRLIPASFISNIELARHHSMATLSYEQTELDRLGEAGPIPDPRLRVTTSYVLDTGLVARTDRFVPNAITGQCRIIMEFASFSRPLRQDGNSIYFADGIAESFHAGNNLLCELVEPGEDPQYRAPTGAFRSLIRCTGTVSLDVPFELNWTLRYRSPD